MNRREFIRKSALGAGAVLLTKSAAQESPSPGPQIMTVTGPVNANQIGTTLSHEHVLVDFVGADQFSQDRYDQDDAFKRILPFLKEAFQLGCRTLFECTPAYLGRDPVLLKRLAIASQIQLVTNTGYYGAGNNRFLPKHAFQESAGELAKRWIEEWENGIDDSGVRPGFMKIGVGGDGLSPLHQKLVVAAARTHQSTGLAIASHTGPGKLALEQLNVLSREGVAGTAFIWVHAQGEADHDLYLEAADRGCWISLDGFKPDQLPVYLTKLEFLKKHERLDRVLISHDAGWYSPGENAGGTFRGFDSIFRVLIPKLKESGYSAAEIELLLRANPTRAFARIPAK